MSYYQDGDVQDLTNGVVALHTFINKIHLYYTFGCANDTFISGLDSLDSWAKKPYDTRSIDQNRGKINDTLDLLFKETNQEK